jgi:hypothetical protein
MTCDTKKISGPSLVVKTFYMKLRRKVRANGVSMFVVAGCLSRSSRAGLYETLPARNLKQETRSLLTSDVEFYRSLCPQDMGVY